MSHSSVRSRVSSAEMIHLHSDRTRPDYENDERIQ